MSRPPHPFCCPVCLRPEDKPAKIEAQGACCCFHAEPNFVPSDEQLAEAVARLAARAAENRGATEDPRKGAAWRETAGDRSR